jgi:CheY-like chemotaxis protein
LQELRQVMLEAESETAGGVSPRVAPFADLRDMGSLLQRAGFEVTTAAAGNEALALLTQQSFDLIYLDIRMPDMSSLEVLKTIHARLLSYLLCLQQPDLNSAVEALSRSHGLSVDINHRPSSIVRSPFSPANKGAPARTPEAN